MVHTVYCPRCQKPFRRLKAEEAMEMMMDHGHRAHPEYFKDLDEDD